MRRVVIGVFKSLHQAERALSKIETEGYASSQISLVIKKQHNPSFSNNMEYAEEITGDPSIGMLHDFDSFLVQADEIDLPGIGSVMAGGPVAGALVQGDKTLAAALSYYGVSGERAAEIENFVDDGFVLAIIETNSTKSGEVANLLSQYGAHMVEKWSKTIEKPLKTWS
ncbi:MAG TPA: hypothetical protein VNT57_07395 [Desulfobacteria bacterium]|nr:hypothetical protein [Desulfobacteria bacterium]